MTRAKSAHTKKRRESDIQMSKTLENINKISFIFFAVIGLLHVLSMLMLANSYAPEIADPIYRTLDLPFLLATLIYGGSAFQIGLNKVGLRSRIFSIILIALVAILFVAAIYTNFFFPDIT